MSSFISNLLGSSDDGGERRGWRNSLRARGRFTLPQRENTLKETRDLETTECSGHVRDTNVEVFMIDQQSVDKLGQHDNAEDLHDMPYQTGGSSQGLSVDTEAPDGSSSKSLPPKRSSFLAFAGIFRSKTSQLYSGTAQPPSEESPSRKPTVGSDPENYTCINLRGRRALPKDQPEVPIEETPVYSPVVASEAPVLPPIDIRFSPLMVPILLTELEEVKLSRSSSQKVDPLWKRLAKRGFATLSSSDTGPSFQISRPSDENIKEDSYVTADGFEPAPLTPTRLLGIIQRSPLEGDIDMRYLEGRVPSDMISCFAAASASRKPSLSSQSYEADAEDNAVGGRALQGNPKKLHGAERAERYEKMFEHCRVGLSSSEDECVKCRTRSLKESKVDEINQRVEVSVGWTVSCAKDDAGSGKGCLQVDGKTSPKKSVRWSDQVGLSLRISVSTKANYLW